MNLKTKKEVIRVDGKLNKVVTILDEKGKILHKVFSPLMVEFHPRDLLQVILGASLLAIPVAYTEETWRLGEQLPLMNVFAFLVLSLLFISAFVYYNYYRSRFKDHIKEFSKRVLGTYLFSFLVVGIILSLIQQTPWSTDWLLAIKRIIIVSFPASMSAAIADVIK